MFVCSLLLMCLSVIFGVVILHTSAYPSLSAFLRMCVHVYVCMYPCSAFLSNHHLLWFFYDFKMIKIDVKTYSRLVSYLYKTKKIFHGL